MKDMAVFEVDCPCCRAALLVDAGSKTILSHKPAKPETQATDLLEEVERVKASEKSRDARFVKHLDAQRRQGAGIEQRFADLLEKAKTDPSVPGLRDIDLD